MLLLGRHFNGIPIHLNHRDVTFTAVSRAPLAKLEAYKKRMGWSFPWVSSHGSDFNRDYDVSFTAEELQKPVHSNYKMRKLASDEDEWPGITVFCKDETGAIFHTYSCYMRGIDMVNGAYQFLDLCRKAATRTASTSRWRGCAVTTSTTRGEAASCLSWRTCGT